MTNCVYTPLEGVQGSPLKPDVHRPTWDSGAEELGSAYNSVLSLRKLRKEQINAALPFMRPAFATYCVVNAGRVIRPGLVASSVGHLASVTGSDSRVAR